MPRAFVASILPAVLWAAGLAGVTPVSAGGPTESRTLQVHAETAHYISSGAWYPGGLLLLDLIEERLQRLDGDGHLLPLRDLGEMVQRMQSLAGSQTQRDSGEVLIQMGNREFWVVRVAPSGEWTLRNRWSCETCSVHSWSPLHAEQVFGVGEIPAAASANGSGPEETEPKKRAKATATSEIGSGSGAERSTSETHEWLTGLFWISSEGTDLAYPLEETELPLYLMGFEWVTTLGNHGYAIVPEPVDRRTASGYRYLQVIELAPHHRGHRVVTRLPVPVPDVTFFQDQQQIRETLAAVSQQQVPLALLGWEGYLYLVQKNPLGLGIWRIDPTSGGMEFLDFAAVSDFVTVVPGAEEWAFLHKGPVLSLGQQELRWVTFYPASGFRP